LVVAGLVVLVVALALPYAIRGPKFILDDWPVLANRHFSGVLATAGRRQLLARPGAWLVYTLTFGLVGAHPLALYAVQVLLGATVAATLFIAARFLLPRSMAAAIATVWVLLPNHASLEHWASTLNIVVCLELLLLGVVLLALGAGRERPPWGGIACLFASALCYEASIVAGAVAVVAIPWMTVHRVRWRSLIAGWAALLGAGAWMLCHTAPGRLSSKFTDFTLLYQVHFGSGIVTSARAGHVLALGAAAGSAIALGRLLIPGFRTRAGTADWLVLGGLVVIVAGAVPFAKFPFSIVGVNDRADVVSSVGAAMAWVGLGAMVARVRPAAAATAAAVFVAAVLPVHAQQDRAYARAGGDVVRLLADLRKGFPRPAGPIVVGPGPLNRRGVVGLLSGLDASPAVELAYGDRRLRARIAQGAADFASASEPLRFDQVRGVIVPR
jgi:hypothetical protein